MAGIAGIYSPSRPASLAELRRITAAVEYRGADGITFWHSGPIALAHLQFHTTPESFHERQPLLSPGKEACLVWNGRLDNRDELLNALTAKGARPVDTTDPGLVLAAYLLWGTDCVQRLVGDFALAVWDTRHKHLWCARDCIGVRPFYYFWDGKTFIFGPEIRALLAHPLVSLKINEGMVGEYLADNIVSRDETLYADIRRLPAASALSIDVCGRMRIDSWWNPDLSLLHYRNDEEYGAHFRHLFDQSVCAQMRSNTPVGVSLSGGLDSSSIAVTAQALLDANGRNAARVFTVSMVGPGKFWDESEDIAAIVDHAGLDAEMVQPLNVGLEHFRQRAADWRDFPGVPNGEPMTRPISEAVTRRGGRVVLSGIGGDEWLQAQPQHVIDLAANGDIKRMLQRGRSDWDLYSGQGRWQTHLARHLLSAAAPEWALVRRRKRRLARSGIFSPAFLRRTQLGDRLYSPGLEARRFSTRAQKDIFQTITSGLEAYVLEGNDLELACAGAEVRFPFFDRRLAEFCLRLPEEQRKQGSSAKWALRTAMRGRLPERVQKKEVKAEFSDLFATVIHEPQAKVRLQKLAMLRHTDWLDPRRFAEHATLPDQPAGSGALYYGRLWMALGIDLWLENLIEISSHAEETAKI